jgi:hypothetical protein
MPGVKKVTRSPKGRVEALLSNDKSKIKMDSSLTSSAVESRRDDEQKKDKLETKPKADPSLPNVAQLGHPSLAQQPGAAHPAPRVQRRASQWLASAASPP